MAVYFVYRCHYGTPTEKHVRRFEYDTVLDWAKAVWKLHDTREEAKRYAERLFSGINADAFCSLFQGSEEYSLPHCPRTMADVEQWFTSFYCEEEAHGPHHIQCLTDWGDNQRAVYVFDDHYRANNPGKVDFLLLGTWELPAGESDARTPKLPETEAVESHGDGEGALYFADTYIDCKYNLDDLGPVYHVNGLRLPDLARYLLLQSDSGVGRLEYLLVKLRDSLREVLEKSVSEDSGFLIAIREQPEELTNWGVYSDWLQERDLPPAGVHLLDRAMRAKEFDIGRGSRKPELDLVKVTTHMAQACKHEGRYPDAPGNTLTGDDWFEQFFFFDDRWAAAHPTLAAGILTFAARWDVLS